MNFQTTPLATSIHLPRFLPPLCHPASASLASSPLLPTYIPCFTSSPHSATLPPPASHPRPSLATSIHLPRFLIPLLPPCIHQPRFLTSLCHPASTCLTSFPHSATLHPPISLPTQSLTCLPLLPSPLPNSIPHQCASIYSPSFKTKKPPKWWLFNN